jgi:hypothetical protein
MDNVTTDPGIQLHWYHSHLGQLLSDPDGPQVSAHTVSSTLQRSLVLVLYLNFNCRTKETLVRICCAMLIIDQKCLLAGDFTSNLKLLQNYQRTSATSSMSPTVALNWSLLRLKHCCVCSAIVRICCHLYKWWYTSWIIESWCHIFSFHS